MKAHEQNEDRNSGDLCSALLIDLPVQQINIRFLSRSYYHMAPNNIPHKQLLISGLIGLAVVAIGLLVSGKAQIFSDKKLATQEFPRGDVLALATSTSYSDRDSDADGLPDWEEHLFGSDPLKFDTDGDGTPDGEEVRLDRDPAKVNTAAKGATPNDVLPSIQDPHFASSSTDILGIKKDYFAKFLRTEGDSVRKDTFKNLLKRFDPATVVAKNQLVDLNASSDNSIEALRAYGNSFGLLIEKYSKRSHRTEEAILLDASKASSSVILKELQLPAIDYKNFSQELKILMVPTSMAPSHLKIVNGYEQMGKGLLAMQSLYSDPIVGAGGYQGYTLGRVGVTEGYAEIVVQFIKQEVSFTAGEPGYPFYANTVRKNLPTGSGQ